MFGFGIILLRLENQPANSRFACPQDIALVLFPGAENTWFSVSCDLGQLRVIPVVRVVMIAQKRCFFESPDDAQTQPTQHSAPDGPALLTFPCFDWKTVSSGLEHREYS